MLRDCLVCGVMDDRIQRKLLAESELSYKKAMEIAMSVETAHTKFAGIGSIRSYQ